MCPTIPFLGIPFITLLSIGHNIFHWAENLLLRDKELWACCKEKSQRMSMNPWFQALWHPCLTLRTVNVVPFHPGLSCEIMGYYVRVLRDFEETHSWIMVIWKFVALSCLPQDLFSATSNRVNDKIRYRIWTYETVAYQQIVCTIVHTYVTKKFCLLWSTFYSHLFKYCLTVNVQHAERYRIE